MKMTTARADELVTEAKRSAYAIVMAYHAAKKRGHNRKAERLWADYMQATRAVDAAKNAARVFYEEISQRPYPKALRQTHVFREDGGNMPYEVWMGKIPYADNIVGMMFEDGRTVGRVP